MDLLMPPVGGFRPPTKSKPAGRPLCDSDVSDRVVELRDGSIVGACAPIDLRSRASRDFLIIERSRPGKEARLS